MYELNRKITKNCLLTGKLKTTYPSLGVLKIQLIIIPDSFVRCRYRKKVMRLIGADHSCSRTIQLNPNTQNIETKDILQKVVK